MSDPDPTYTPTGTPYVPTRSTPEAERAEQLARLTRVPAGASPQEKMAAALGLMAAELGEIRKTLTDIQHEIAVRPRSQTCPCEDRRRGT